MNRQETTASSAQRYLDALVAAASTAQRSKRTTAAPAKTAQRLHAAWWARRGSWFAASVVLRQTSTAG